MTAQYKPASGNRGIEWCDETRNATGGCLHDCKWEMPDGTIAGCYAKDVAETGAARAGYPHGFAHHYWRPGNLPALAAGKEPLLIFVDSMSDMFAANVPDEHVVAILRAMRRGPHHAYQCLTKAAPRILKFLPELPPNLWVGVSSPPDWFMGQRLSPDQQRRMLVKSLEVLREVKEKTPCLTWMSAEPVSWDLAEQIDETHPLDWIVIGAASSGKRYFQPDPRHVARLLRVMDHTRTPVFYKGNIRAMFAKHDLGSAELNRWREDFPGSYRDGSPIPAVARRQRECERNRWQKSVFPLPQLGTSDEGGLF